MAKILQIGGPGIGIFPERVSARCTNRAGAVTRGDVVQLELAQTDGDVTGYAEGDSDGAFASVVVPLSSTTLNGLQAGIFAIALEDVADNAQGEFLFQGVVEANVDSSTVAGSLLVGAADGQLDLAATSDFKVIGIALEADTSNLADIWFDGLNGFGQAVDA